MARQTHKIIIPGTPVPKGRPRMTRGGRVYTPAKTVAFERAVAIHASALIKTLIAGPTSLSIEFVFKPPKSWPKWKIEAALDGKIAHTCVPDLDNLVKAVKDALNGVAYSDDSYVVATQANKRYGGDARTEVIIAREVIMARDAGTAPQQISSLAALARWGN